MLSALTWYILANQGASVLFLLMLSKDDPRKLGLSETYTEAVQELGKFGAILFFVIVMSTMFIPAFIYNTTKGDK